MLTWKLNSRQVLICLAVVILIWLMAGFNNRMSELNRLSTQREGVAVQSTNLMQTQTILQIQIAYATSIPAVEEWAYVEGHYVRPGDFPVVPLSVDGTEPTPVPVPESTLEPVSNWQVWLALFFDAP